MYRNEFCHLAKGCILQNAGLGLSLQLYISRVAENILFGIHGPESATDAHESVVMHISLTTAVSVQNYGQTTQTDINPPNSDSTPGTSFYKLYLRTFNPLVRKR